MLNQQRLPADRAEIRRDLTFMTRRWGELPVPVRFEIRAFKEGSSPQVATFKPDWMDDAVEWAANMAALGYNCYAVRNPIRDDVIGSAKDTDIVAAFFLWADCDDSVATDNIRRFDGPPYTAIIRTGKTPSPRVHIYWELAEPCTDMAAWRDMQQRIAQHFQSDPAVINPSRIMRIAGTPTFPDSKKQARGYVSEMTALRTDFETPRQPVTMEQMGRVFAPVRSASAPAQNGAGGLSIDTGGDYAPALDRDRTRIQALSGEAWHNAVVKLVASYVAKGLSDDEIHQLTDPLTLAGYTVEQTRREVQQAIDGARRKGWTPEPGSKTFEPNPVEELTPEQAEAVPAFEFSPWVAKDISQIPYPEFVYSDFYARGYTSVTLAAPKVGKSMLGLAEALDACTGRGFLSGIPREPQRVVYYNAEDDQAILDARVAALLEHYGIPQSEIEGRFFPTSGVERGDFYLSSGQEGIINEPLFVSIEKFLLREKIDLIIFDPLQDLTRSPETNDVFRILGQRIRRMASTCKVSNGLIHHTRKVTAGMTPTIDDMRGGSALRGTARFNRILISMTEDEAVKANVPNHRHFFRIGDMESNLAPPSSDVNRWFEKVSVHIANGQHVGAVRPWQWPDAFDGVSVEKAKKCRLAVMDRDPRPRVSDRAKDWVGYTLAPILGIDPDDKSGRARLKAIIKKWIEEDVLAVEHIMDRAKGRETPVVIAGRNDLEPEFEP